MDPITRDDDELFGTVMVAARLGRSGPIVARLRERYEKEWDGPAVRLPVRAGHARPAAVRSGGSPRAAELQPRSWRPSCDSSTTNPTTGSAATCGSTPHAAAGRRQGAPGYIAAERARAAEDVTELIERQAATAWQPWFACPYVLAARLAWESGDQEPVAGLVSGAASRPLRADPLQGARRPAVRGLHLVRLPPRTAGARHRRRGDGRAVRRPAGRSGAWRSGRPA